MLSTPSDTTNSLHPNTKLSLAITNDTDSVTCHTIQLSHNTHTYDIQSSETKSPNIFWIKGVVRRDKVCPTWFHLSKVFSCIAVVSEPGTECDGESTGSALSGWFQRLMVSLSRQNLLLVIYIFCSLCIVIDIQLFLKRLSKAIRGLGPNRNINLIKK